MKTRIEIESIDSSLLKEIFGEMPNKKGFSKNINDYGVIIYYDSYPSKKAFPTAELIEIIVEVGSSVSIGLFTNWLYDKIKSKSKSLKIGKDSIIEISKDEIEKKMKENLE